MSTVPSPPSAGMTTRVDLVSSGLIGPLPSALLSGRSAELLAPLRLLDPAMVAAGGPVKLSGAGRCAEARRRLAPALEVANTAYGHPRASELAARLRDPDTLVVVTGQQPGMFGGPLYTLSKMVAVSRWVARLEAEGRSAVAVFWVANEDHDYAEVSRATVPTRDGLLRVDLGEDPSPLLPVGMRTLGAGIELALERVTATEAEAHAVSLWARVAEWYRPDTRFGEAFCRLMVDLMGERSPLLLDAMDPVLKEIERPHLERLVTQREQVGTALADADRRLQSAGYPLQVTPQASAAPLFVLHRGERRRVQWSGGGKYSLRGTDRERPIDELLETLAENPSVVSPGVLARPVIQDAVLGTALQVLGPGELSYMAQAASLYPVLEVEAPAATLRPQILVLDPRQSRQLAALHALGIEPELLLGDADRLERELGRRGGGDVVGPLIAEIEGLLDELRAPALAVDSQLESPWRKTREQVTRALARFSDKTAQAAARLDDTTRRRVDSIRQGCRPGGMLQERLFCTAHFADRFGPGFVDTLWQQLDLDPRCLQLIEAVTPTAEQA